ncbi:RagB/SusD family nutrient uptake outer membrane protein [Arsenicibacter rosenii]|uniref:RagB/SusD family nutrient uptake outer membrane protein n=1 Tax=Arsenicibacter rosenii TaxID=1750698 RepID=A0A1S2VI04_9BACT|nr:RagB/SusD family nutrient uptake outer membrane protein [Arsenicibacter rosenii]OIN58369.1 RagB/SusD family nutrient uptake outer membrane protein [Arsenicibacter rosenii]
MTKNIKQVAAGAAATLMLTCIGFACKDKFLDIPATGQLGASQLASKKGIEGAVISVYAMLNGRSERLGSSSNWVYGSIRGGDANKGTDPGDFSSINPIQRFETIPTGDVAGAWRVKYEGISRANNVLRLLASAGPDVTDADKARISAEAKFLRGFYYFELKRLYNNTPYVDESVDYAAGIEKVKNDQDLWPKIVADLQAAYTNLPETQDAAGRANKWAAAALLAKVYMYQQKYTEAKTLYDLIIANGKTANGKKYALVAKYADLYKASNDNNEESVFAIQAATNTGDANNANPEFDLNYPYNTGTNGPAGCCGFFQPSFELVNSFRTNANGLPLLDGSYNAAGNEVKNDQGILSSAAFTPDAGNLDPRLDHSVGRRGIPYLDWQDHPGYDWIRKQDYGGPYTPKKYVYYRADQGTYQQSNGWHPGYTAMNYTIIRYADVLLMAAEAEVEAGSLTKALEYVNMVRKRAANPAGYVTKNNAPAAKYVISEYPASAFASKEAARNAVRFERKLELSGEGHRFFDLLRWGVVEASVNAYLSYEGQKLPVALGSARFTPNQDEYLPIPQAQIDLQGKDVLKQNPGYQ